MAGLFPSSYTDWLFPSYNIETEMDTPDLVYYDGQLRSNGHSEPQGIRNAFLTGHCLLQAPSGLKCSPVLSQTSTYPPDQSGEEIIHGNFDMSFNVSTKHSLTLDWCEQRRNRFQDVNSVTTPSVGYTGRNFESLGADMELGHDYMPESNQSNIVPTYHNGRDLSRPNLDPPFTTAPFFSTPSSASSVCTVHPTPDARIFVFRCTFPRCRAKTFSRWADFYRHYNGAHASEKTVFWCPVSDCSRSEGGRNRGFPRKDKMMVHVEKMHRGEGDEMHEQID